MRKLQFSPNDHLPGQKLNENQAKALAELDPDAPWSEKLMVNHRRTLGVLIPFCFYQLCWWCLAFKHDFFALFPQRWILSVTMIFGATVAGKLEAGQVSSEL